MGTRITIQNKGAESAPIVIELNKSTEGLFDKFSGNYIHCTQKFDDPEQFLKSPYFKPALEKLKGDISKKGNVLANENQRNEAKKLKHGNPFKNYAETSIDGIFIAYSSPSEIQFSPIDQTTSFGSFIEILVYDNNKKETKWKLLGPILIKKNIF